MKRNLSVLFACVPVIFLLWPGLTTGCRKSETPRSGGVGSAAPSESSDAPVVSKGAAPPKPSNEAPGQVPPAAIPSNAEPQEVVPAPEGEGAEAAAERAELAALKAELENDEKPLTKELLDRALKAVASCKITEHGVDPDCEGRRIYELAQRKRSSDIADTISTYRELGQQNLAAPEAPLRAAAAQMLSTVVGGDDEALAAVVKAAAAEKEPVALRAMLDSLGAKLGTSEAVAEVFLAASHHEDDTVRMEATGWLASSFAVNAPGSLDRVVEVIQSDPSPLVRAHACKMSYRREDEALVPLLWKIVQDETNDPALYEACFDGLVHAWVGYPNPKNPSRIAYEHTLEHLKAKPRSEQRPASWPVRNLRAAKDEKWRARAAFFDAEEVKALLIDLVRDGDANWMTRSAAVEALPALGVTRGQLLELKTAFDEADFPHKHVGNAIERMVNAMPD